MIIYVRERFHKPIHPFSDIEYVRPTNNLIQIEDNNGLVVHVVDVLNLVKNDNGVLKL